MERQITFVLSFVTGFVDTVGFMGLSGLFLAQITGNLVLVGASLTVINNPDNVNRLLMIPVYLLGGSLSTLINLFLQKVLKTVFPGLLLVESGFLLLFAGLGYYLTTQHNPLRNIDVFIIGSCGALAIAIQNSSVKLNFPGYVSTTVQTANVSQFSIVLINYIVANALFSQHSQTVVQRQKLAQDINRYAVALLGFIFGTGAGAVLFTQMGLIAATLPAILMGWVALVTRRSLSATD